MATQGKFCFENMKNGTGVVNMEIIQTANCHMTKRHEHQASLFLFSYVRVFVCVLCFKALSSCLNRLSHEPCPFNNLKYLKINKQKDRIVEMPAEVINYVLESSPSATFIIDLPQVPQKRSWNEVDTGIMAKKLANLNEDRKQSKTTEVYRSRSSQEALSSSPDQLPHEPSSFNNLKHLNQTDPIPRTPNEVRNHLFESSSSATSIIDLSQ
ncbi:hypothetical protein OSB04_019796, partial [Centaurea solstitialis]